MRVAVCDDDPVIRKQLTEMVSQVPGAESCGSFKNGKKLLEAIQEESFDVILMDIEWDGEEQGIQYAAQIHKISPDTYIIYVTGYTEKYVQQIFLRPANLIGFLMKPIDEGILRENLQKAEEKSRERDKKRFIFKYKNEVQSLPYEDIQYIESSAHRLRIVSKQEECCCYDRLENVKKSFPEHFLQCHKSYLVNLEAVRKLDGDHTFVMEDGALIPISKKRYVAVRETYFDYLRSVLSEDERREFS